MDDKVTKLPRCQALKSDGTSCERIVGASQKYCYSHDKSRATERKVNASKAARSKAGELGEVKAKLKQLAEDVLAGDVDRADASVVSQLLGVYLRAVATELKVKEQQEILERVEELEALLAQQKQGGSRRGA